MVSDASDSTPSITGNAEAGSTIKLFVGATELGTATTGSGGTFVVTSSQLTDGTYNFTLTATDAAGNTSTAGTITHTVNVSSGGNGGESGGGGGGSGGGGGGGGYGGGY